MRGVKRGGITGAKEGIIQEKKDRDPSEFFMGRAQVEMG